MPLVGGQGWELNSINKPGGADYAHHITACPLGFENIMASLYY